MTAAQKAYLQLHFAVLLFGLTAILGKMIQLSALVLVWWRVLITSLSLMLLINVVKLLKTLPRRQLLILMGIGTIVGLHWLAFYGAIKLSNSSVGVLAMGSTSLFSAILEPLILKKKFNALELGLGLLIIPGMALVVNGIDFSMVDGLVVGVIAALLAALFAILNKSQVANLDAMSITFVELSSACLFLGLVIVGSGLSKAGFPVMIPPHWSDWLYLLILALLCTTFAYVLSLNALKHLSAFTSNLTMNLEPVYAIVLAWLLLNEDKEVSSTFYWGAAVIMAVVFSYPLLSKVEKLKG
ncbi:DMT family transporter [Haliscomenobacter sp.]|uniref:DMT family transporter n=1 Tax=Haliscomenobacter sp. TaxID=2717303 RepID=UPI0035939B99